MNTKTLKPFDLQAALNGEPVMLRGGCKAFVRHHETEQPIPLSWQLWGVKAGNKGDAELLTWSQSGDYREDGGASKYDIIGMFATTRTVNGFEVPAPEKQALYDGDEYYSPVLANVDFCIKLIWDDDDGAFDIRLLDRGLVFLNKEDAIANAKAMLGIDPYEEAEE